MSLDFRKFNTGALFLVRTPDVFPVGYAEESFRDMKENLHFDFAALLETWNCFDGVLWKSDKYPRSHFWAGEDRDPIEECFTAADKYGMAFLPEAGMMHDAFMLQHPEGMRTDYDGSVSRYGRVGLTPSCPLTAEYLIDKYDTLLSKFGHHPSCKGVCLPAENGIVMSYDRFTEEAYREAFGTKMPSPDEVCADKALERQVFAFLEERFLKMYRTLAKHIKQKYGLPLMHYPLDLISTDSFAHPEDIHQARSIAVMNRVEELDLLNLQLHPPLYPNPYFFKLETEYLMANAGDTPCMADTHFYHEMAAGRVPDMTPKRVVDSILSTVTPNGISFFCYGFMAEQLPPWKKELNPGAPVYRAYSEPHTLAARREMCVKAMGYVEQLRDWLVDTRHTADCAIYFPESLNADYMYSSYAVEHIFGLHELLNAAAIPVTVTAAIPTDPAVHKAVILDSVRTLSDEEATRLERYIENGGKVLVIGKCCEVVERVTGLQVTPSTAHIVRSADSKKYNGFCFRIPVDGKHYAEHNGEGILFYEDGTAAATRRGNVYFFGAADTIGRFPQYRDFHLAEFMKAWFTGEGLDSGVSYRNVYVGKENGHQFVSCDIFENDRKKVLFIRNFGVEQNEADAHWVLPSEWKITEAIADGVPFAFENGKRLPLFEHFVAVYAKKE